MADVTEADDLIRQGLLSQKAGVPVDAEWLFAEALSAGERQLGPDSTTLVPALTLLAGVLVTRGAHREAETHLMRALTLSERQFGADHPDLVVLLNDLSRLCLRQGAYARAEPLLQRLLVFKRSKGEEHPEVATVLASLASVRQGLGDHDAAEQLYRRVLQIRENTLAPNHFAVAAALEHLAEACAARAKNDEALLYYERALSVREQTLGAGHSSLRASRERIADLQLQASEESLGFSANAAGLSSAPELSWTRGAPASRLASPATSRPGIFPAYAPPAVPSPSSNGHRSAPAPERERAELAELTNGSVLAEGHDESPAVTQPDTFPDAWELHRDLQMRIQQATEVRAEGFVATLAAAMATRRVQNATIGVCAVALLLAALAAYPRTAVDDDVESGADQRAIRALANTPAMATRGSDLVAARGSDPFLTRTSRVSPEVRQGAAARPPVDGAVAARSAERTPPGSQSATDASLELAALPRPAMPNLSTAASDSVVRAASIQSGASSEAFTRQMLSGGSERAVETSDLADPAPTTTNPKLLGSLPRPEYPDRLRRAGVEGELIVQFAVESNGRPDLASLKTVRSPHELLTKEVQRVVRRLRFEPARTLGPNSKPVAAWVELSFHFDATSK